MKKKTKKRLLWMLWVLAWVMFPIILFLVNPGDNTLANAIGNSQGIFIGVVIVKGTEFIDRYMRSCCFLKGGSHEI